MAALFRTLFTHPAAPENKKAMLSSTTIAEMTFFIRSPPLSSGRAEQTSLFLGQFAFPPGRFSMAREKIL
jgi:hypothetical protein